MQLAHDVWQAAPGNAYGAGRQSGNSELMVASTQAAGHQQIWSITIDLTPTIEPPQNHYRHCLLLKSCLAHYFRCLPNAVESAMLSGWVWDTSARRSLESRNVGFTGRYPIACRRFEWYKAYEGWNNLIWPCWSTPQLGDDCQAGENRVIFKCCDHRPWMWNSARRFSSYFWAALQECQLVKDSGTTWFRISSL